MACHHPEDVRFLGGKRLEANRRKCGKRRVSKDEDAYGYDRDRRLPRELSPVRKEPTITGFIRQIVNIHDDRAI
jgi:hypothetical protein